MYSIQFDGDLERRGLVAPEAYRTLEEVFARLKALFLDTPHPWNDGCSYLPDEEDDRILVWRIDPDARPTMTVVWAFLGTHFSWDNMPGLPADDVIPGVGSLRALIG